MLKTERDSDALHEDDALDADDEAGVDEGAADSTPSEPTRLWLAAACACLLAAAALWLLDRADAAFVVAALGVVAWFLNVRVRLRRKNSHGDTEAQRTEEEEEVD